MGKRVTGRMYNCSVCGRVRFQRRDCKSCLTGSTSRGTRAPEPPRPQCLLALEEEAPPADEGLAEDLATLGYTRPRWIR